MPHIAKNQYWFLHSYYWVMIRESGGLQSGLNKSWSCCYCLVAKLCPTLRAPVDCSCQAPPSMGILQAGILQWVAIPSSRGSSRPRDQTCVSYGPCITGRFFTTEPLGKPTIQTMVRLKYNRCLIDRTQLVINYRWSKYWLFIFQ